MTDVIRKMVAAINDLPHCAVHGDAMRAVLAAAEAAGWKLVPVEPTRKMQDIGNRFADYASHSTAEGPPDSRCARNVWDAMIAAALRWEPYNKPRLMVRGDIYTQEEIDKWTAWLRDEGPEYFL